MMDELEGMVHTGRVYIYRPSRFVKSVEAVKAVKALVNVLTWL